MKNFLTGAANLILELFYDFIEDAKCLAIVLGFYFAVVIIIVLVLTHPG